MKDTMTSDRAAMLKRWHAGQTGLNPVNPTTAQAREMERRIAAVRRANARYPGGKR